jgi:hypothetical protein
MQPHYFIRTTQTFSTVPEAANYYKDMEHKELFQVGYYIPQPHYRTWVPNWLIRLLQTKTK